MEEASKKLAKISSSLPPVLIRKTLFCDEHHVGRGDPPKPKTKNRGRGYKGRGSSFQTPGQGFQDVDHPSQFSQRQCYSEGGASQQYQGKRELHGRKAGQMFSSDVVDSNLARHSTCDDCLQGPFEGDDPNRSGQGNGRRSRESGNIGCDQKGIRLAQSLSGFTDSGDQSACQAKAKKQSRFQQNQLLVSGLSAWTTEDCLVNFIEVMSGGEVEDVMLRNDKALITMANDITGK